MIWSFVLAIIGILGLHFVGKKKKIGWAIGFFVQILWIIFAVVTHQYGFIISAIAYGIVNANNWFKWKKTTMEEISE